MGPWSKVSPLLRGECDLPVKKASKLTAYNGMRPIAVQDVEDG
jgi:hypothetical protein